MNHIVAIAFPQQTGQIFPRSQNPAVFVTRYRIHKALLGMGVVNQDLRRIRTSLYAHILIPKRIRLQKLLPGRSRAVHCIKRLNQRLVGRQFFPLVAVAFLLRTGKRLLFGHIVHLRFLFRLLFFFLLFFR